MNGSKRKPSKLKIQKKFEEENIMKNIRNLFKLKNKNETMKGRTFRYMKTLSERQEEDYYKPVRVDNF